MLCIFKRRDNEGQGLQQAKAEGGGDFPTTTGEALRKLVEGLGESRY